MAPRTLITGFGPFPGVEVNPTERVVRSLAESGDPDLHAAVLAVDWSTFAVEAASLLDTVALDIALHFGVNQNARTLRVESTAFNRALPRPDRLGRRPQKSEILDDAPTRLEAAQTATALAEHLSQWGFPVRVSHSAGRYLCNALYFVSLDHARRHPASRFVAFVHVPPSDIMAPSHLLAAAQATIAFARHSHSGLMTARPTLPVDASAELGRA